MKFLFVWAATAVLAVRQNSPACLLHPKPSFGAGGTIQLSLAAGNQTCEATLTFANDEFLPLHYTLKPVTCRGDRQVELPIPVSAPNGEADLSWICTGDSTNSCVRTKIISIAENRTRFFVDREDPGEVVSCKDVDDASSDGASVTSADVSGRTPSAVGDSSACEEAEVAVAAAAAQNGTSHWPDGITVVPVSPTGNTDAAG